MELKELKKEVEGLPDLKKNLAQFQRSWLKKLQSNTNFQYPSLQRLDRKTREKLNWNLSQYSQLFRELKYFQFLHEKFSSLAQCLIELKLSTLNGDTYKPKVIVKKLTQDDFLSLKLLIDEVNQFAFNLNYLQQLYRQTNQLLLPQLPLEHSVAFLNAPHQAALDTLLSASQKQKKLLKLLGREFISLAKELKKKKRL